MSRLSVRLLCSVLVVMPAIALAQQNGMRVENAWSRAAMQGRTGVVYLTIVDDGAADRLTSIATPVAAKAELHESFTENGVAKMRAVGALPVAQGNKVTLAPGGYHIMLMNLKQPLRQGDAFPVTLNFEKAGQVTATVTVQKAGGSMPMGHDAMGGMNMPGMPMHGWDTPSSRP
jgi:periplasmic copper chaperone A